MGLCKNNKAYYHCVYLRRGRIALVARQWSSIGINPINVFINIPVESKWATIRMIEWLEPAHI